MLPPESDRPNRDGSTGGSATPDFKLGDWWVRPLANELERGDQVARIEARSMDVLVCLARHAPAIVAKDRIVEEVWHDAPYTSDDVISHAVWELRKALGDSARAPRYIRTVPRKGYVLVGEILRPQGAPLPVEGVRIDRYDLAEVIGQGSMGVIYQATDRRLGRTVAIKFLAPELTRDPKACQRFEREARLAASLDHPNLATIHEIGETAGARLYIVCAFYASGSLEKRLARGPVATGEAIRLTRQLLAGLGAAHERGVVHRDIKPANLLLDEHGTLKIADFGIAKLLGATDLTRTGTPLGTPAYQSPEQSRGQAVDHRTDLWSAGVVLFELLTGRRPDMSGGDLEATLSAADLSEPLHHFLARALDPRADERFDSASEMREALDAAAGGTTRPRRVGRLWRRVALAMLLLVAAGSGWFVWRMMQPSEEELADAREAEALVMKGRQQWRKGNHDANLVKVRDPLEQAVTGSPEHPLALGTLAVFLVEIYLRDRRSDLRAEITDLIDRTYGSDPTSTLARTAEAWLEVYEGEAEKAARLAREAIAREPTCDADGLCDFAYFVLAQSLWQQAQPRNADAVLEDCIENAAAPFRCHLRRAQIFSEQGDFIDAAAAYRAILKVEPRHITASNDLGELLSRRGNYEEAIQYFRTAFAESNDPIVGDNLGYAYYQLEAWDKAEHYWRASLLILQKAGKDDPNLRMSLGDLLLVQGDREGAYGQFDRAVELFDQADTLSLANQAIQSTCLAKAGDCKRAMDRLKPVLENRLTDETVLIQAARVHALCGERGMVYAFARELAAAGVTRDRFFDDPSMDAYEDDPELRAILLP